MSNTSLFNDYELKIIKIIASGDFKLALQFAKSQKISIVKLFKRLCDNRWIHQFPYKKTAFEAIEALNENNLVIKISSFEHFQFLKMLNASCITITQDTSVDNKSIKLQILAFYINYQICAISVCTVILKHLIIKAPEK